MYLTLLRSTPSGNALPGQLYLHRLCHHADGTDEMTHTFLCNTLENTDYMVPPLIYRVQVTHSPKFGRLMPLLLGVPKTAKAVNKPEEKPAKRFDEERRRDGAVDEQSESCQRSPLRQGIRIHRGTKPEHSKGCILVPTREMEDYLTDMLLRAQQDGEEIRLDIR